MKFLKLNTGIFGRNVYVDGSSIHNGRPDARSGTGVYFLDQSSFNSSLPVYGAQDSGRAEVAAISHALRAISLMSFFEDSFKHYTIHSDSRYAIGVATGTINGRDRDLATSICDQSRNLRMRGVYADISYILDHRGHPGNGAAHKLAHDAASGKYYHCLLHKKK